MRDEPRLRHRRQELSRRGLLRRGLSAVAAATAWAFRQKAAERDRFGGCLRYRFKASGFFRLEKAGRWWLVTPDGNAFLSFGVNHVAPHLLRQAANQAFWLRKFSAGDLRDPAWMRGYRDKVRKDLAAFGFNTLGTHSATRFYEPGSAPYLHESRFVDIAHWMEPAEKDFLDVFSTQFEEHCDGRAREFCRPHAEDPYLIGYSMTDCPIFTDLDAAPRENSVYGAKRPGLPTWPRVLRNLAAEHPGKRAYVDAVREIYRGDIAAFNRAYRTEFGSFDALAGASGWRPRTDPANPDETRDNHLFLTRVVERYYQVATRSIRRYDRNHLILGDKLNGNTDTPDAIIGLAGRYIDLIFYQTFGAYAEQKQHLDRWARITRKPVFNGDSSFSVPTPEMPDPYGPHCKDQQERARRSLVFAESAFARSDFVGWSHCGWMDGSTSLQGQSFKQHAGLQTAMGEYHEPMRRAFADLSERLYVVAKP